MSGEDGAVVVVEGPVEYQNSVAEELIAEFGWEQSWRFGHESSVSPN